MWDYEVKVIFNPALIRQMFARFQMDLERDVFSSMSIVQESIAPKHIAKNPTMEDDISMVHELTQVSGHM